MRTQAKVTKPEIAAYNHGYCFAITYCSRNSINIDDLDSKAGFYYNRPNLASMFKSGYLMGLDDVNSGRITASQNGGQLNAVA